ncbi:MAG: hypothetical protein IJY20_05425 [Clostridia bacterium]|nr:hypothetical protein [Clostridia bacterium]
MEKKNENNTFQYTYSAAEQAELRRIREKYAGRAEKQESKLERLRRLDRGVTEKAQAVSLIFGILGALLLGLGMSLVMSELAAMLGLSHIPALVLGIALGILGGALVAAAYPMYQLVTRRARKKIAPEVLRLTDELMQ